MNKKQLTQTQILELSDLVKLLYEKYNSLKYSTDITSPLEVLILESVKASLTVLIEGYNNSVELLQEQLEKESKRGKKN